MDSSPGRITFGRILIRSLSFLCLAFLLGTPAGTSVAQGKFPPWRQNLDCDSRVQKYRGVDYCTGLGGSAHVLVIDLHESGIRLEYVIALGLDEEDGNQNKPHECKDVNLPQWSSGPGCYDLKNERYYPVMSLLDAVRRNSNTVAVINSDYGAGTQSEPESRGHGPEGLAVVQGSRIDGLAVGDTDNNAERRPWMAVSKDSPLRVEINQFPRGKDNGGKPDWVYTGVGGAPWLIREGQIEDGQIKNCTGAEPHSCASTFAQTAVALSKDHRWLYLVVVVGRDAMGTAQFLHDVLQPWQAIKMDGGGSSQLWYGGLPGNSIETRVVRAGDHRKLSQYLAVLAYPGSGIVIRPEPAPPDHPVWWDQIWQDIQSKLDQWWNRQKAELAKWWEKQKAAFIKWLKTQLQKYLNQLYRQLCGTAMLPVEMMLVWRARRRRRW